MPFDAKKYPPYWKQFSEWVRFERAGSRCEFCGVGNYYLRYKSKHLIDGEVIVNPRDQDELHLIDSWLFDTPFKLSTIVLTVAHLDNDDGICKCEQETGFKCAKPDHVKALCQACHLSYDAQRHRRNRIATRDAKRGLLIGQTDVVN